jgi:hypothetical protein
MFDAEEFMTTGATENRVGFAYGIGTFAIDDIRQGYAWGSFLGSSSWLTGASNQILGPKTGVVFQRRLGKWTFDSQGLVVLGANAAQVSQRGVMGEGRIPGALNQLLYARTTKYASDSTSLGFSPAGEIRAAINYELNNSITLRTAWSTLVVGNVSHTTDELASELPNLTFSISDDQYTLHQFFCGVEYVR